MDVVAGPYITRPTNIYCVVSDQTRQSRAADDGANFSGSATLLRRVTDTTGHYPGHLTPITVHTNTHNHTTPPRRPFSKPSIRAQRRKTGVAFVGSAAALLNPRPLDFTSTPPPPPSARCISPSTAHLSSAPNHPQKHHLHRLPDAPPPNNNGVRHPLWQEDRRRPVST